MKKIEDIEQYWQGETYLVTTFIDLLSPYTDDSGKIDYPKYPIYPHLHNDKENGQDLPHYHVDMRFVSPAYIGPTRIYPDQIKNTIELHPWKLQQYYEPFPTPISMISKSRLKHKCIHKGKCPHRGFDLSHTPSKDGIITCPLHGLQFEEKTGKLKNYL